MNARELMFEERKAADIDRLRWLTFVYVVLLIFEGSLRKWVVPSLSAPLLVVRDPIVLTMYFLGIRSRLFPSHSLLRICMGLSYVALVVSLFEGLLSGKITAFVIFFGYHADFMFFPLMFLMPQYIRREDIERIGRWILLLALPMGVLMVAQFHAGPNAFINRGAGLASHQISGVLDKIRPPGTFSFATGASEFIAMATGFVFYGLLQRGRYPTWLLAIAAAGIVIGTSVSISRSCFIMVGIVAAAGLIAAMFTPRFWPYLVRTLLIAGLAFVAVTQLPAFREGMDAMAMRVDNANATEASSGGMSGRVTNSLFGEFSHLDQIPLAGYGIGMGTNVGAVLLTGRAHFLLAESEWPRVLLEMGPALGIPYICMRLGFFVMLLGVGLRAARRFDSLPLLMLGACGPDLVMGEFAQTTTLGFCLLDAAICMAASHLPPDQEPTA